MSVFFFSLNLKKKKTKYIRHGHIIFKQKHTYTQINKVGIYIYIL